MKDWTKRIGLADYDGTTAEIKFWDEDEDGEPTISLWLGINGCGGRGFPTAEAARQIAAALLDAADAMERETAK